MSVPIYQVDAFTDRPFAGNPAAVCMLQDAPSDAWMQNVAAEMNLAETAFLQPAEDGYSLRWFTPTVEVDLCGHATLASAHALWESGRLQSGTTARFQTRSGLLTADLSAEGIVLDFPAERVTETAVPDGLEQTLGAEIRYCGRNRLDYLIEVSDAVVLRSLHPDFRKLATLSARGFIVTCVSDKARYDFLSRFFAPGAGIDEDPVTGSAHCGLGPYWQDRLRRAEMRGCQVSKRGGVVGVRVIGDRVKLIGQAVTVMRGELTAGP